MRGRIVPELDHARMAFERGLDDATLHAASASVYDSYFAKACRSRSLDVLGDEGGDVARRERVKIDLVFDGNADRLVGHVQC